MLEQAEVKRWQRLTDAMLRHAAQDDPEAFAQVVDVLERAMAKLPAVAARLRPPEIGNTESAMFAYSWTDIARALGVTRSAAHQRFGPHRITVTLDD